jgi:hypothetical protein
MLNNPSKLSMPLLKEANYPTWNPTMEARLHQFGVFHIVTGETQEPSPPGLILPTQDAQGHDEPPPQAALILKGQMTFEYQKQLSVYHECKEKPASDILAHLSCLQQTHVKDEGSDAEGVLDALKLVHIQHVPGMPSPRTTSCSVSLRAPTSRPPLSPCALRMPSPASRSSAPPS